jgi:hypothetical protein
MDQFITKIDKHMKKHYLFLLPGVISVLCASAQSPITLGNSNMPSNGDTLRYTNVDITSLGNYNQTGQNFQWNFSSVISTGEGVRSFKSALQTPYALFFLQTGEYGEKIADTLLATPIAITKYYNFYKKTTTPVNAFVADGVGLTITGLPVPSYYSDKDELYKFPMTYPKYDSTSFKFKVNTGGLVPIDYMKSGYRVTVVDGWGKVTTPYGIENCLRLITTQYSTDTITVLGVPVALPNYVRSYQWLTLNSKIPYMEIIGNLVGSNFTITQARYRGYNKSGPPTAIKQQQDISSLEMYPNPVKDKLWLNAKTNFSFEIFDVNGKLVKVLTSSETDQISFVDVSDMQDGLYVLKASSGTQNLTFKFFKVNSQ